MAATTPDAQGQARRPWWHGAFGAAYLAAYAHRDDGAADRESEFALRALDAAPRARVLDAGCGAGRHACALAARGLDVVGLDFSSELIAAASRRVTATSRPPRWIRGDVRALPFRAGAFDHVASFFTSFGYFDDAGDRAHMAEMRRVLRPSGRLLLDFLNPPRVVATLVPSSRREVGGADVVEHRAIREGRVEKSVVVRVGGAVVAGWSESVRLYDRLALEAMAVGAGFRVRSAFGDLSGAAWNPDAPRTVLLAEAV